MSSDPELQRLRKHIDEADRRIVDALKERMAVVEEIRKYKDGKGLDVHDQKRADEVLETRVSMGGSLSADFMREIFRLIISHSEKLQRK